MNYFLQYYTNIFRVQSKYHANNGGKRGNKVKFDKSQSSKYI